MASHHKQIALSLCMFSAIAIALMSQTRIAVAQESAEASSNRKSRDEVLKAIPFRELNEATRKKLSLILEKPSLYRKMPVETIRCDHAMHTFLVRKPEVIVGIWKLMGITQISARRTGEFELEASDGVGTDSNVELVYGTPGLHIFYGEGVYEGPMIRSRVSAKCVIVLQSNLHHDQAGTPMVTDRMDVFLQIDNLGARVLVKTLHPLVGKAADHNFVETARFLTRVSDAAQSNPSGVQNMATRLPDCSQPVREQFVTVVSNAAMSVRTVTVARQPNPQLNIPSPTRTQ